MAAVEVVEVEDLPIEEDDMTVTELHARLVRLLEVGLRWRLEGEAVVLAEIFTATGRRQVSADILVRFGAAPGERRRYVVEDEGPPDVTIEIVSTVNHTADGLAKVQAKRDLFGELGVPEHIEIDPEFGTIQVWSARGGVSRSIAVGAEWVSERLRTTFRFVGTDFEAVDQQGRRFELPELGFARAEAEASRAEAEASRAEAEAARAARYRALLAEHGISPDDGDPGDPAA